ncbi:MAG: helix-turn-helix domain-containing protein [Lachnospiraceae bacterium]|nr:helix-turn-helix domain-containing protein [Lachnospiraceae bacterium]
MDQEKIGAFLRELRKERNMSQEQLAEVFNVSSRSISRWENGKTMPDISLIIELADYFEVDIRELLNGERKSENMDKDMKETLTMVADYTKAEKRMLKKTFILIGLTILTFVIGAILAVYGLIMIPPMGGRITSDKYTKTVKAKIVSYEKGNYDLSFPTIEYRYKGTTYTSKMDFSFSDIEQSYPIGSEMKIKINPNNPTEMRLPHSMDDVLRYYKIPITVLGAVLVALSVLGFAKVIMNGVGIVQLRKKSNK